MWTTVTLLAVLGTAPNQADHLEVINIRATYGMMGLKRPAGPRLPGDSVDVAFDLKGLQADSANKFHYTIGLELTNSKGRVVYQQEPRPQEALNTLGGDRLPATIHIDIGLDQLPDDYTFKLTATDLTSKKHVTLVRPAKLLPRGFGIVRLTTTSDPEEKVPASALVAGQPLWISFRVIGFERDPAGKQPHVAVEMRVLDEDGKPTLGKAFAGAIKENVSEKALSVPVQFLLGLNRPGKFTVEIKASDLVGKKEAKESFPISVQEGS